MGAPVDDSVVDNAASPQATEITETGDIKEEFRSPISVSPTKRISSLLTDQVPLSPRVIVSSLVFKSGSGEVIFTKPLINENSEESDVDSDTA